MKPRDVMAAERDLRDAIDEDAAQRAAEHDRLQNLIMRCPDPALSTKQASSLASYLANNSARVDVKPGHRLRAAENRLRDADRSLAAASTALTDAQRERHEAGEALEAVRDAIRGGV